MPSAVCPPPVTASTSLPELTAPRPASPAAAASSHSRSADRICVGVRLRPDGGCAWQADEASSTLTLRCGHGHISGGGSVEQSSAAVWSFDSVFDVSASSAAVFDRLVAPVLRASLAGMNGTCFAYGQTSSGKSHTMAAMTRMAARAIFDCGQPVSVRLSYFEIYNEHIRDLQSTQRHGASGSDTTGTGATTAGSGGGSGSSGQRLRVRQHPMYGVYIAGLTEAAVADSASLLAIVQTAEARRAVASTAMNSHSSRAHTVCRFTLTTTAAATTAATATAAAATGSGEVRQSVFQLIDLAGSERCSHSQTSGARLKEGGHINKSLLELSTVMSKLSQQQMQRQQRDREPATGGGGGGDGAMEAAAHAHTTHIPYRNSTLTRVLEPALGGNSRTAVIACINAVTHAAQQHLTAPHCQQLQPVARVGT